MKCELTINALGQLTVTDESGYAVAFGLDAMKALINMVTARQMNPTPKFGEAGKPSAIQILQFMQEKKTKEITRRARVADEILDLIDLDLELDV